MTAFNPLPSLLRASAWDAGNMNMREAGRSKWNDDDWNAAASTQERLIRSCYGRDRENEPNMCYIRFQVAEQLEKAGHFNTSTVLASFHRVIDMIVAGEPQEAWMPLLAQPQKRSRKAA